METGYKVKLDIFEGPLDLLLYLIQKDEIDIYDIPIAHITEQYLRYIRLMRELDVDLAGDFLLMAATLIHIKSRMLLPVEVKELEVELEDPRSELVHRLLEHKKYKAAAEMLWSRAQVEQEVFTRALLETDKENPEVAVTTIDLVEAFKKILERHKKEVAVEIEQERVNVEMKITYLRALLQSATRVNISELLEACASRLELVVTLLTVLELAKEAVILLVQESHFGTIYALKAQS